MTRSEVIVDTNVLYVVNGKAEQASLECLAACNKALVKVQAERRTLLDELGQLLEEYRKSLDGTGQADLGTEFFFWLWDNQFNPIHCRKVPISVHPDLGFAEFPEDPRLSKFDCDERKFVAVALASETTPELLNATDRDWWNHRQALAENGVNVVFLCQELMEKRRR